VWSSLTRPGTALAMFFCNVSATCCICCFCWESVFHFSIRSFPRLALAELVAFWTCRRMVFRSVCGVSCVCWGMGACCPAAPNPRQKIRTKITVLADFMGEHSCKYLRCESPTAGLLPNAPFSSHCCRSRRALRNLIEYTKRHRLLVRGHHPRPLWPSFLTTLRPDG